MTINLWIALACWALSAGSSVIGLVLQDRELRRGGSGNAGGWLVLSVAPVLYIAGWVAWAVTA